MSKEQIIQKIKESSEYKAIEDGLKLQVENNIISDYRINISDDYINSFNEDRTTEVKLILNIDVMPTNPLKTTTIQVNPRHETLDMKPKWGKNDIVIHKKTGSLGVVDKDVSYEKFPDFNCWCATINGFIYDCRDWESAPSINGRICLFKDGSITLVNNMKTRRLVTEISSGTHPYDAIIRIYKDFDLFYSSGDAHIDFSKIFSNNAFNTKVGRHE